MGPAELGLFFITVLSGTIGQFFLKIGANKLGAVTASSFFSHVLGILMVPQLLIGLVFYAASAILYILLLTRIPLSVLGPSVAIQYVLAILMGRFLFQEAIPIERLVGLGLIICGVILVVTKK
jgi:multidrug transporter EmrE-like cation transporter